MTESPESSTSDKSSALRIVRWGADRVAVQATGGKRRILARSGLEFDDVAWQRYADETGISLDELRACVADALKPVPVDPEDVRRIWARAERGSKAQAESIFGQTAEALAQAFALDGCAWVEWDRSDQLAVLDVDWHGVDAPAWAKIERALLQSGVTPRAYWRSRSGGLHAVFEGFDGIDADELAAACAVSLMETETLADCTGLEILARTGAPPAGARVSWQAQHVTGLLRSWQRRDRDEPSADEIEELRQERGWLGRDAAHDQCPIDPGHVSQPGRRPVFFGERGISCQSCAARGVRPGGFVSWAELIQGHSRPNRILECARALADWSHASLVIAHEIGDRVNAHAQRLAYRALCKILHGADDPRISRLSRNREGDFVRGLGCWLDPRSDFAPIKPDQTYFRLMPSNSYVSEGQAHIDWTALNRCASGGTVPGYPPIIPIRGALLYGQFREYPSLTHAIRIANHSGPGPAPRYRSAESFDREAAWAEFDRRFPGLDRNYLRLLLLARGYAESGIGRVPRILTTGPSRSAKSTTVGLAAGLLGDHARIVPDDPKTFREAFDKAVADVAGWVLCDEFAKPQPKTRVAPRTSNPFSIFLPLESRDYTARLIYVGPVRTIMQSAVVITGTQPPEAMRDDLQLARRFIHVPLSFSTPDPWERTCGFGDVARVREHLPEICDAIWSEVVDEFFSSPAASFEDAARLLGYGTLQDTVEEQSLDDDGLSSAGRLRELFELVCSGDGAMEPPARHAAHGRRRYDLNLDSAVSRIWRELCDDYSTREGRFRSERVSEVDLVKLLGLNVPKTEAVWLEVKGEGSMLYLRFGQGNRRQPTRVNGQLRVESVDSTDPAE